MKGNARDRGMAARAGLAWALLSAMFAAAAGASAQELPADGDTAVERLDASPRHGEWIRYDAGAGDDVSAWIVYPQRDEPAPVVVVIHEIFGLTDWIRAVADQLAAEGYVAIAPDLLSGKGPEGGGTASIDRQGAVRAIRDLDRDEVRRRLRAAGEYAMALPSAAPGVATVGFCWGGRTSFDLAAAWPELDGAVVYYGSPPDAAAMTAIEAPVLGLYGEADNRVTSTVPAAQAAMDEAGKEYTPMIFEGAGHGFLRAQSGQEGANLEAARRAWPATVAFFRDVLGG